MKKPLIILGFIFLGSLLFGDVISEIERLRAWDLADAYYKVGLQYQQLGEESKGQSFTTAANRIFPGYDPAKDAPTVSRPQVDGPIEATADQLAERTNQLRESILDEQAQQIITNNFNRFLRGLITKNATTISSVMDFPVVSPEYPGGISQGELEGILGSIEALSQELVLPDDLFDLESMEFQRITENQALVTIKLNTEAAGLIQGDYTFIQTGQNWKIQALGALGLEESILSPQEEPRSSMENPKVEEVPPQDVSEPPLSE